MEGLTPGRIVHYVRKNYMGNDVHLAAIVTAVLKTNIETLAGLHVFGTPNDPLLLSDFYAAYDENMTPGTWHWIERA